MKTVQLPDGILQIREGGFSGCTALKSINLPYGLLKIYDRAFYNCRSLESISLPSSLNEIKQYAFANCSSLYIKYLGTKQQLKRLPKGCGWSDGTPSCMVQCYDGEYDVDWGI